jgi:hypothetical protein
MNTETEKLFDEAIKLELNVSDLYFVFYTLFPEDAVFWWSLVLEEKNHASLLKTIKSFIPITDEYPKEILPADIAFLIDQNNRIRKTTEDIKKTPERIKAFQFALEIEESAREFHFQTFIKNQSISSQYKVFQELNNGDKDHAERIIKYITENNLISD